MKTSINFNELVGETAKFYGVDNNCFKLGSVVFEVIENESDGYRSMMDEVAIIDGDDCNFSHYLLEEVEIMHYGQSSRKYIPTTGYSHREYDDIDGYVLVGVDSKHPWLIFGTNNNDGYYPCFTFRYSIPPTEEEVKEQRKETMNKIINSLQD